jgi:hypothetical protein
LTKHTILNIIELPIENKEENKVGFIINDEVQVLSTTNEELDGKQGTIKWINVGESCIEARVEFHDGSETWIDTNELINLTE